MILDANKSSSSKSKELNSISPFNRILHINELDPNKCDANLLKQITDGSIQNTKLYTEGTHKIQIQGVMILTSNDMLNIRQDSGSKRRTMGLQFKNRFLEPHEDGYDQIDNKTTFKKDKFFLQKLSQG